MSVTIGRDVKEICRDAFRGCSRISSISVDKKNTKYDSREGCNAIINTQTNTLVMGCNNTYIPNSVISIAEEAFFECIALISIDIPNSVTSIGRDAFEGCYSLTSITIPNSVTSIGNEAFGGCYGLRSITIPCNLSSIDNFVFYGCNGLTSVIIPNCVKSIGSRAFQGCNLRSIVIGKSVKKVIHSTFENNPNLEDVYCYTENPPSTGENVFQSSMDYSPTLHVPAASISLYKTAETWKEFNIVPLTDDDPQPTSIKTYRTIAGKTNDFYSLDGHRIVKPQKGLNIVRMSDGTTKKTLEK